MSFFHSLKWSFFAELVSKAISPVVFIVLARLLTPEDFGVMSAALMVIAFSQIFWEAGMGQALIQRQSDSVEAANVAFWVNIGLGVVIFSALLFSANRIALTFFQDVRVTAVLQVMSLQVLLGAMSSVQTALLQKQMKFKKLFWVRLMTVAIPGLASIPLAWYGMGYWALVVGTLVGQFIQVLILWHISDWRPGLGVSWIVTKPMIRFGAWVGASGLLAWFYAWADSLIVGKYLGIYDLGLYRTGNQFSTLIFTMVFGPIVPVLYSHLSKIGHETDRMRLTIEKLIKLIIVIAVPVSILVFTFSSSIGEAFFGQKWPGIGFVIGVLALMHGFSWIVGMNGEVYRAMGKPSYETIVTAGVLVVYVAVYLWAVQIGFEVFVWARFLLAGGAMFIHLYLLKHLLGVGVIKILLSMVAYSTVSYVVAILVKSLIASNITGLWSSLFIGLAISVTLISVFVGFVERQGVVKELGIILGLRRI